MHSLTNKYMNTDIPYLRSLLDLINEGGLKNRYKQTAYTFSWVFDIKKKKRLHSIRKYAFVRSFKAHINHLLFNSNGKTMFMNMVHTDGYDIDFILTGHKK